jgi:Subtilase family
VRLAKRPLAKNISRGTESTEKWFSKFLGQSHKLLDYLTPGKPRVRIAILDTGLNKDHPEVSKVLQKSKRDRRIKQWKSWVPNLQCDGNIPGDEDEDGHGTHCAMVANRVAPNADIYIARIFKNRKSVNGRYVVEVSRDDKYLKQL